MKKSVIPSAETAKDLKLCSLRSFALLRMTGGDLLLECFLHLPDGRLASPFLRGLLILTAPAGRDLADQAEVAALELTRRELLRRQYGTTAALLAATGRASAPAARRCAGRLRLGSGGRGRYVLATARTSRLAAATPYGSGPAARRRAAIRTAAGSAAQRIETLLEAADLAADFTEVAVDLARRNAPLGDQPFQNVCGLSRREGRCGLSSWSWHVHSSLLALNDKHKRSTCVLLLCAQWSRKGSIAVMIGFIRPLG